MRYFFKFIVILTLISSLIAGASTAIVYYYQDDIEQIVIAELNKILIHPLEIEDIEISTINSFPYTSIEFNNIKAIDSFGKDTLLRAEKMSLKFNAIDLYNQKYNIQEITIVNGYSSIYYSDGKPNYELWKVKKDTNNNKSSTNVNLNNILLNNFKIEFTSENQDIKTVILNESTQLNLQLDEGVTKISLVAQITNKELIVNDLNLLANKDVKLNSSIQIDSLGQDISLVFESDELIITSDIKNNLEGIKVTLDSQKVDFEKIEKFIPKQFASYISQYNPKGLTDIKLEYNKKTNQKHILDVDFSASNFYAKTKGYELENAVFSGNIYSNKGQDKVEIIGLKGLLNKNEIEAEIELIDFIDPQVKVAFKTELKLSQLSKYNIEIPLHLIKGNADIDVKYNGKIGLKNTFEYDISMAQKEAKIIFKNLVLQQQVNTLKLYNGFASLSLNNEQLNADSVSFSIAEKSDVRFNGAFDNVFKYLFLKNAPLRIAGDLRSDWMLVDECLNQDSTKTSQEVQKIIFPKNIIASFNVFLTDLSYDKFHMRNFSSKLTYNNKLLKVKKISLETMSGNINGDLSIQQLENENIRLISSSNMDKINVRQLFYEFHNFGQKTMRHKHLRGIINSDIYFRNEWDPYFNNIEDRMYSFIDLKIEDGQLLDFEPLSMMSDYIALNELKRIKFSTLENQIEIKEGKIEIPFMEIYSSAADIAISGTHTFENIMDYDLKILLNEILSNKLRGKNKKKKTNEFGIVEDDGVKGLTLFLKMEGSVDDPKVTPGTIKLRESLKNGFKKEKKEFTNILKREFKKEKDKDQEIENTDYNNLIEWED
jgi:hypothetical protein